MKIKIKLNENFKKLGGGYLFSEIAAHVEVYKRKNPQKKIISLGIGDLTRPIAPSVSLEMSKAAAELGREGGFVGYGNTLGMTELRKMISARYRERGVRLDASEIFISDGAKSDLGNLCDVLGDNEILICDPIYPVYLDSNVISGRKIRLLSANESNGFLPSPVGIEKKPFVIYLCSPNNPTGATFSRLDLQSWVDFARECGSLIIFDAAYESYIRDASLPHSIFEIEGARECAIEVCSFSKSSGFTGVRCGWTAIPSALEICELWKRRQNTKFNGASYISQRGALASLSAQGIAESQANIEYYMENARIVADFLKRKGIYFMGGENAPYIWAKQPRGESSWEFFDYALQHAQVVVTPGAGFGAAGEGFFRISSFAPRAEIKEAIERLDLIF